MIQKKLFDLIQFENTSLTLNLLYGETKTFNVSEINVYGYSDNLNSKVVYLKVGGGGSPIGYIYFINDNKVTKVINPSADNDFIMRSTLFYLPLLIAY